MMVISKHFGTCRLIRIGMSQKCTIKLKNNDIILFHHSTFRTVVTHFVTVAKRPNLKTLNQDSKSKIKEEQVGSSSSVLG